VGRISLADARLKAQEWWKAIRLGIDPQAQLADTFAVIASEYMKREGSKLRTAHRREQDLERLILPALGQRPIADIRRSEISRLLERVSDENGPEASHKVYAIISKIMDWHSARSDHFVSPVIRGMSKSAKVRRDRTLKDEEIRAIWQCRGLFADFVKLLLLTACRRSELAEARWSELENGDLVIPALRYKTGLPHVVPLSQSAQAIFARVKETVTVPSQEFVFSTDGRTHIAGFVKFKRKLDAEAGLAGDWTLHDCRRTARTLLSRAGQDADTSERCLGHALPALRATYDRHSFYEEKKRAFEALASLIERIVEPQPNVIALAR